ncbi:MAG: CBS domain-containing protein [Deltaproteobacteria bacterium]|nr:CBS domain-containing protein [Deltaproteobacteria bacterium]
MKIRHWMTPNPITVTPDTLIIDAKAIMKEHKIRRLPVVDKKGKLVGLVTYRHIIEASPSQATSLSIHELNYLILKLTVQDVMRKDPITVSPEDSVPDVMLAGHRRGIGAFPVMENGNLIGIITENDVFNAMIYIFGTRETSSIIPLQLIGGEDSIGVFRRIAEVMEKKQIPIYAMFTLPNRDMEGITIYVRVKTKETEPLLEDLALAGFKKAD